MATPTYDEIRKLTDELRKETKVKARRELGNTIYNLLKSENTLRKLVVEATPEKSNWPEEDSIAARRCRALSLVWSATIQGAIHVTQSIVAGRKVKLTEQDVTLPYNLLIACDKANDVWRDTSVSIPILPKKVVRNMLKYCLELLADENVAVSRLKLLEMLSFLCCKPDYVGVFKYHNDFANTLSELFIHLTPDAEENNVTFFNEAAKALDNLFSTTKMLGIQMNAYINDTIAIISAFCKSYLVNLNKSIRPQAPALPHLYNTVANIIRAHPDHAIGPIKRFGRSILRHARKCYPNAKSPLKEALNAYIAAHLFLSQFAGTMQGKNAGNMGDLGKASLTSEILSQLVDLVMKGISSLFESQGTTINRQRSISWSSLDLRQRQHLELSARLLACAQQEFLSKAQWDSIEDPPGYLLSLQLYRGPEDMECVDQSVTTPGDCPSETFLNSPWMRCVLLRIACEVDWQAFADKHVCGNGNPAISPSPFLSEEGNHVMNKFPFLERIKNTSRQASTQTISCLPLIGTCAELFPTGQCWSSNIFKGWTSLAPEDLVSQDVVICQCCTIEDFSLLVFLLAAHLEEHGGPTSNREAQLWLLVTLTKLTAATSLFYKHSLETAFESLSSLEQSWQLVWHVLFRPDLGYTDYTKEVDSLRLGEVVLVLVRDMIQHRCTDPLLLRGDGVKDKTTTFLYRNQSQVWNLHAFRNASTITSAVVFELICWMCQCVGISDHGVDLIDPLPVRSLVGDEASFTSNRALSLTVSRRERLICLGLFTIERYLKAESETRNELIRFATLTIVSLMRGRIPSIMVCSSKWRNNEGVDDTFRHTTIRPDIFHRKEDPGWREVCMEILWRKYENSKPLDFENSPTMCDFAAYCLSLSVSPQGTAGPLENLKSADFVTETESTQLSDLVELSLRKMFFSACNTTSTCWNATWEDLYSSGLAQPFQSSQQILLLKILFTVQVGIMEKDNTSALRDMANYTLKCFNNISHKIDADSLKQTTSDVARISRSLLEICSISSLDLSSPTIRDTVEFCRSMLHVFTGRLSDGTAIYMSTQKNGVLNNLGDDDLMDDDIIENPTSQYQPLDKGELKMSLSESSSDDESQQINRRKRKRNSELSSHGHDKSPRHDGSMPHIQDIECAKDIASFLLALEPSLSNCELVCLALLGADHELDPTDLNGDVDLRSARACLSFLTSPEVLNHFAAKKFVKGDSIFSTEAGGESVISLLHKVLDLLRVNTGPLYLPSLNGFMNVASVLNSQVHIPFTSLAESDVHLLVGLILYEGGTSNRPFLRAVRMRAASSAFRKAGKKFHDVFDKHFAGIVKMAMTDSDIFVRRQAYAGVNAALSLLDENKVLHAINKIICPISQSQDPNERQEHFSVWYRQAGFQHLGDEEIDSTNMSDFSDVLETDAIRCRSIIAASITNAESFLDAIFELAMIPLARPDLEFQCLQALDKVARLRCYGSVEIMLNSECPALLNRWIKSVHTSLPLLLTAPGIVRFNSQFNCLNGWRGHEMDTDSLKHDALLNFVSKFMHVLIPLSLFHGVSSMPMSILSTDLNGDTAISCLATHEKLKLLSSMSCEDVVNNENIRQGVKLLLRRHVPDIRAFCYAMLQSPESAHRQIADSALLILASVVGVEDVESRMKKKAHVVVRRIIDLVTYADFFPSLIPSNQHSYVEALTLAVEALCNSASISGDKLRNAGTNALANLIRSVAQLDKAPVTTHERAAWKAISLQADIILSQTGSTAEKQTSIGFCIHMLTEVLLKNEFAALRPDVLSLLKKLLKKSVELGFSVEFGSLVKRLVGASLHVHESCQKKILKDRRDAVASISRKIRRSCGLAWLRDSSTNEDDLWSCFFSGNQFTSHVPCESMIDCSVEVDLQKSIVGTYAILKWTFDHSTDFALDSLSFVPVAPPYAIPNKDIELLSSINESYAAQFLALSYFEKPEIAWTQRRPTFDSLELELQSKLKNRQAWMTISVNHASLNLDQRLIFALLVQLESAEYSGQKSEYGSIERLKQSLSLICSAPCPQELQIAASRCLGKLEPEIIFHMFEPDDKSAQHSWLTEISQDGEVSVSFQTRCLEVLGGCLMAANPFVSQAAVDTLEALLSTKSGLRTLTLMKNEPFYSYLEPFSSSFRMNENNVTISLAQIKSFILRAGIPESCLESNEWCWREELWLCFQKDQVTFEIWVCTLTSALISCCISSRNDGKLVHRDGDGEFLWLCQKMCALEHNMASHLFPFVVLYLLGISDKYNALLTKSFGTVLQSASSHATCVDSDSSNKVVLLIIDTIDVLRKTSQARFLAKKHSRNLLKIVGRQNSQKSKDGSNDYNAGIPEAGPWEGVPFGIILTLDGLLVAESCIHVRRYASALFFLDLYLNARFRSVGDVFDDFANFLFAGSTFEKTISDISGLEQTTTPVFDDQDDSVTILKVMSLAGRCFQSMGEYDALEAVTTQRAAIEFNSFGWDIRQSSQGNSDPVGLLRSLNVQSSMELKQETNIVVDSMEALEFHALLQSYIDGILSDETVTEMMQGNDIHCLKEKWHENRLRKKQWEVFDLKDSKGSTSERSCYQADHVNRQRNLRLTTESIHQGFFGAISAAYDSYLSDDIQSCQAHLVVARKSVISDISRRGGIESSFTGMVEVVHKLRSIDSMEHVWRLRNNISREVLDKYLPKTIPDSTLELMAESLHESVMPPITTGDKTTISFIWLSELAISATYARKRAYREPHRQEIFESLVSQMCTSAVKARRFGRPHVAAEILQRLHRLLSFHEQTHESEEDSKDHILLLRLEESKILESQGDFKGAIRKSQQIVDQLIQREKVIGLPHKQMQYILTDAQLSCGIWLTKYEVRQAGSVLEGYLQPGADRARRLYEAEQSAENANRTARASLALGQIASSLHRALIARVQSPEWKQSSSTDHHASELERCEPLLHDALNKKNKAKKGTKQFEDLTKKWEELYIYCEHLRKDLRRTSEERQSVITSMQQYLRLAVESYSTALALASTGINEDFLRPISELMSMWFNNCKINNEGEVDINMLMKVAFGQVPTFRWVPLTNQLFSRIEKSDERRTDVFQAVLQELIFKMCSHHPYHCILPLLALSNGKKVGSGVSGRHASAYIENVGNSKVAPANGIIARLKREASAYVSGLLDSYATLSDSYIHLAGADTSAFHKTTTKDISFSKVYTASSTALDKCLTKRGTTVDYPPVIFTSLPTLQPSGNYGEGLEDPIGAERVRGFKPVFSITETGLHRPKIVVCLGTKGGEFRQLVKGEDEIRQDAIMSQVFTIVNDLMLRRRPTSENKTGTTTFPHKLHIATYNVVPLSPATGVLEWVENTTAFGDVVFGRSPKNQDVGLHARYYPNEWNFLLCRRHFVEAPLALKRETYDVVCRHFSPCFRFFFVECFGHDMMAWHAARMRYTRSVAVSSMVGHILGIGDRHTSNILVHTKTGEVVQIDFGIVFEQGKLLHTPERVPFRLTRNMVDGMGPCGTEGTFVRSCEETMRVLRENASTLLTILSAVVADPLYKWSVSPVEGLRRQKLESDDDKSDDVNVPGKDGEIGRVEGSAMSDDANEMGKKAIAKINDKLQGYEESTSGEQQGIEGQVQLLINSARDVDNLCLMYPGWSPFV